MDSPYGCAKDDLAKSNFNLRVKHAGKIHEANILKTDPVTLLFNGKYLTAKAKRMCEFYKKIMEWNFVQLRNFQFWFFNLGKIYSK